MIVAMPEYVAAEVAYRLERLTTHRPAEARRRHSLRARLHLPVRPSRRG